MPGGLRVAYHERDLSPLVAEILEPLAGDIARSTSRGVILQAHWKFGPHVDFVPMIDDRAAHLEVLEAVKPRVKEWLADHPSLTALSPADYLAKCQTIAPYEGEAGPFGPILANNTVSTIDYRRADVWGLPALSAVRDTFLAEATPFVGELARLKRLDTQVFCGRLAGMMACASTFTPWGFESGYLSFVAHAESYLAQQPAERSRFEALRLKYDAAVRRHILHALAAAGPDGGDAIVDPFFRRWMDLLARTHREAVPVIADNLDAVQALVDGHTMDASAPNLGSATFRQAMRSSEMASFRKTAWMTELRLLVNFVYLLMPTLSVSASQRFWFCHVLGQTLGDMTSQNLVARTPMRDLVSSTDQA